ncbi:nucleolar protein 8 isoform X2 [Bacillus rossius redtenbacheri]|uniref:nucleolar protein 8 isoform X2 n=1 Tax=Bacillus rossius redtenbacheri TaxID=93214 RepID=UPI002FDCADEF
MHVETRRIFVGNLPAGTTEADIREKCGHYGQVLSVEVKQRGDAASFAYVDLNINPNSLNACLNGLQRREWRGQGVTAQLARESFLSRLQREREEQSRPPAPPVPQGPDTAEHPGDAPVAHKSGLPMFHGTKRSRGDADDAPRKKPSMLSRLETFSNVWRDDDAPSEGGRRAARQEGPSPAARAALRPSEATSGRDAPTATFPELKVDLSEQKRLQAVARKKRLFNEQKRLVRAALASVDGRLTLNKKIVFDDDGVSAVVQEAKRPGPAAGPALFEDEEGGGSADDDTLTINRHFEGEQGRQLLELQARYGNDERFRLDGRFRDDGPARDDDEEEEEVVEDERAQNLRILGAVLGRELPLSDSKKRRNMEKPMLRFDPTKPDHEKYEIKKRATTPVVNGTSQKKKLAAEAIPQPSTKVSKEKFYKINDSLKESFQKDGQTETFSLLKMFGSNDEEAEAGRDSDQTDREATTGGEKALARKPFEHDSSFQGTGDDEAGEASGQPPAIQGPLKGTSSFFFLPDDERLSGVNFFNQKVSDTAALEKFSEHRNNLKRWAKIKVRSSRHNVHKKKGTFRQETNHKKLK